MTQSYEQSFDFSESEDEDEGTETASCSSREEDVTSMEGGDCKNAHMVSYSCVLILFYPLFIVHHLFNCIPDRLAKICMTKVKLILVWQL